MTLQILFGFGRWQRGGESEKIIGEWLTRRGCRDDLLIAIKVGMKPDRRKSLFWLNGLQRVVEASLKRLRTDHIDLYFAHRRDAETPLEITLPSFDQLIRAGSSGHRRL